MSKLSPGNDTGQTFEGFQAVAARLMQPSVINEARIEAEQYRVLPAPATPAPLAPEPALDPELHDAIAMELESAIEAGTVGYMTRLLCQVTMPHSKPKQTELERVNGNLTVTLVSPSKVGLPYGTYPRLIMAHVTKQAVLTRSRRIELGDSLSAYMRELGLNATGGRWGSIARLRNHLERLLQCSISCTDSREGSWSGVALHPIQAANLWWDSKRPEQQDLWRSELLLNQEFYEQLVKNPVPYDERVLRRLAPTRSPMALDIYFWLTHRMSYLHKPARVPWSYLQMQFGNDYGRTRAFKEAFIKHMSTVLKYMPVRTEARPRELWLFPGKTSVPKLKE